MPGLSGMLTAPASGCLARTSVRLLSTGSGSNLPHNVAQAIRVQLRMTAVHPKGGARLILTVMVTSVRAPSTVRSTRTEYGIRLPLHLAAVPHALNRTDRVPCTCTLQVHPRLHVDSSTRQALWSFVMATASESSSRTQCTTPTATGNLIALAENRR